MPTSIASPAAASPAPPATTSNGLPTSQGLDTMFLQLLVAQLQNQDPTSPLDPSQFVGQLAQFSELSEVTQIDQILQQYAGGGSSTTGGNTPAPGSPASPAGPTPPAPAAATPSDPVSAAITAAQAAIKNMSSPASLLNHQIQGVF
jgi:flagellar basal-body rod modification protein FlgD